MNRRGFLAALPLISLILPKMPRWLAGPPAPPKVEWIPGPALPMTTMPRSYYAAGYSDGAWRLFKYPAGAPAPIELAAFPHDTPKAGDVVRLEHLETGSFLIGINGRAIGEYDNWIDEALADANDVLAESGEDDFEGRDLGPDWTVQG
jgi:hypothetical protein